MKMRSISRRVYRTILAVSAVCMAVMVTTVLLVNEDLEHTMLAAEFSQERDFILMTHDESKDLVWETPNLSVMFVPSGRPPPAILPAVFQGLPENHAEEIKLDGETYLVTVNSTETGVLYVAKNITHFEDREALFGIALLAMTIIIMAFSLLLAVLSSRRIVKPLRLLSERISRIPVGTSMPRMETDYTDAELHSIALTFNRFLDELESHVRREQSLINLASHELRTPIALMSGALDVLEARGQLHANDAATLKRIRRACDEMRDNVNILLTLARRETRQQTREFANIPATVRDVIDDLKISHQAGNRVLLDVQEPLQITSNPVMVRMLLRNLIQNAIQHTNNKVCVTVNSNGIEIEDKGTGLTIDQRAILRNEKKLALDGSALSGLGLYIVTLMAERLEWKLEVTQTDENGTRIRLTPRT